MFWWLAEHKDGSVIRQYEGDTKVSADKIDRNKLKTFSLMNGESCVIKLYIRNGMVLVYRRRIEKNVGGSERVCHIVGWRKYTGHDNEIVQSMAFIFEDGGIEMIEDFIEDHPWFYKPVLREFELPCQ